MEKVRKKPSLFFFKKIDYNEELNEQQIKISLTGFNSYGEFNCLSTTKQTKVFDEPILIEFCRMKVSNSQLFGKNVKATKPKIETIYLYYMDCDSFVPFFKKDHFQRSRKCGKFL